MEIDRAFLVRTLYAMEGVIDVADRKTDEFDEMRACIIDLTLMLYTQSRQKADSKAGGEPVAEIVASRYGGGYSHSYNLKWFHGVSPLPKGTKLYTRPQQQAKQLTEDRALNDVRQAIRHLQADECEWDAAMALLYKVVGRQYVNPAKFTGKPIGVIEAAANAVHGIGKDQA